MTRSCHRLSLARNGTALWLVPRWQAVASRFMKGTDKTRYRSVSTHNGRTSRQSVRASQFRFWSANERACREVADQSSHRADRELSGRDRRLQKNRRGGTLFGERPGETELLSRWVSVGSILRERNSPARLEGTLGESSNSLGPLSVTVTHVEGATSNMARDTAFWCTLSAFYTFSASHWFRVLTWFYSSEYTI